MSPDILQPCPRKPNCVCSFENPKDKTHYIKPRQIAVNPIEKIKSHLEKQSGYKLLAHEERYLKFEYTSSFFKFTDDIEFLYAEVDKRLHYRSASRVGYSDLGANRKRLNELITKLKL